MSDSSKPPPGQPDDGYDAFLEELAEETKETKPPPGPEPGKEVMGKVTSVEEPPKRGAGINPYGPTKLDNIVVGRKTPQPGPKLTVAMPALQQDQLVKKTEKRPLVLIIDDDHDICYALQMILTEDADPPFDVELAHDGKQGIDAMDRLKNEGRKPVCVLLDLTMPIYPGWSYIGFAERCWMIEVPFRLISAAKWEESNKMDQRWIFLERYRRGGYEIIQKPFVGGADRIINEIRKATEERMARLPPY